MTSDAFDRQIKRYQQQLDELIKPGQATPAIEAKKNRLRAAIAFLWLEKCKQRKEQQGDDETNNV